MKKAFLTLSALGVICLMALYSCHKETPFLQPASNAKSVNLFGKSYRPINYTISKENKRMFAARGTTVPGIIGVDYPLMHISLSLDPAHFEAFISDLNSHLSGDLKSMNPENEEGVILYLSDSTISSGYSIINGVSRLSKRVDGDYDHKFYRLGTSQFDEQTAYAGPVNRFSVIDLDAMLYITYPTAPTLPVVLSVARAGSHSTGSGDRKLGTILIDNTPAHMPRVPPNGCSSCQGGGGGSCMTDDNGDSYCDGNHTCLVASTNHFDSTVYNLDTAYRFRDEVLAQSFVGQKYIRYYYFISYINYCKGRPSSVSLLDEIAFGLECYDVADRLMNGGDTEVIITSAFKTHCTEIIGKYRDMADNAAYQDVLDDIANDIANYEGMQKSVLLTQLN